MASVTVEVHTRAKCGTCGWADNDWRSTGLFNYNDACLIEVALLHDGLKEFPKGVDIPTFFWNVLRRLEEKATWADAHPNLAEKYARCYSRCHVYDGGKKVAVQVHSCVPPAALSLLLCCLEGVPTIVSEAAIL